jgi:hypothetical protein
MAEFAAVTWKVRQGTEEEVRRLFRESGRPSHDILDVQGNQVGKLLSTVVLMHGNQVVRVLEYEGSLPDVMRHMAQQPELQALEKELDQYLEVKRDTSSPEKFREYFIDSIMTNVITRRRDDVDA